MTLEIPVEIICAECGRVLHASIDPLSYKTQIRVEPCMVDHMHLIEEEEKALEEELAGEEALDFLG